jgi:hypothetical protein
MKDDNTTFMMAFISALTFAIIGLIIGIIPVPVQTADAFLDAPIPPTTSSNSSVSNSTGSNSTG